MVIKKQDTLQREVCQGAHQQHVWDKSSGTGSVSLGIMTLEPGVALKEHYHLVEDCMIVLSGKGVFVCDGVETPVEAGDGMMAPAGKMHYVKNSGSEPFSLVYTWPSVQVEKFN